MLQSSQPGFSRLRFGIRLLPVHIDLYHRARSIYDSPIPVNVEARHQRQCDLIVACQELHAALNRTETQVDIIDTIDQDTPPVSVIVAGEQWIADWDNAVAIRNRLEQLAAAKYGR
jgi:hypothetical protein